MRCWFLLNPAAGKGAAPRLALPFRETFRRMGVEPVFHTTTGPGEAAGYAAELCRRYPGEELRFYACGGDGTVAEVARGLLGQENAALGILPCGSGNDFVRNFPGRDFLDPAAQARGQAVPVDLIDFCGRIAVNLCNCGLDADVAHNMPRFRRLPFVPGAMAYQLSILYTFFRPLGKRAVVTLDGETLPEGETLLFLCANGQYYGGGFRGAPLARVDDGLLDICLVPKLGRWKILSILGRYQKGLHTEDENLRKLVTYRRAKRVEARFDGPVTMCADGETFQGDWMTAEVLPGALRVLLPEMR